MTKNNLSSLSDTDEIKTIISWKILTAPSEVINWTLSEIKIRNIIDRLRVFSDSNSLVWDFLIEIDIRKNSSLLDIVNNLRVSWLNFLHILYLFSENDVNEFITIEWIKLSREDIFLWQLLSWIAIDLDKQKGKQLDKITEIYFYLFNYIDEIYKTWEANFNVISKITNKTFLEFLISIYSYYLYMWDENQWWKTVCSIILDFLNHLLDKNKINFIKDDMLAYIEKELEWLSDNAFIEWMNRIRNIFKDYERRDLKVEKPLAQWVEVQVSYTNKRVIGLYERVSRIK